MVDTQKPRQPEVHSEPMRVEIVGDAVVIIGPGAAALTMSAEAAEESGHRLLAAVETLRLESR